MYMDDIWLLKRKGERGKMKLPETVRLFPTPMLFGILEI